MYYLKKHQNKKHQTKIWCIDSKQGREILNLSNGFAGKAQANLWNLIGKGAYLIAWLYIDHLTSVRVGSITSRALYDVFSVG